MRRLGQVIGVGGAMGAKGASDVSGLHIETCRRADAECIARLGENEALYRDVNEHIAEVAAHLFDEADGPITFRFLCECCSVTCVEQVALSLDDYRRVRSEGSWFVVVPGHELPAIERVVERREEYLVVEKTDRLARGRRLPRGH